MSLAEVPFNTLVLIVAHVAQLFGDQTPFVKKNTTQSFILESSPLNLFIFQNLTFVPCFGHLTVTTQLISLNTIFYIHVEKNAFFESKFNIFFILFLFKYVFL